MAPPTPEEKLRTNLRIVWATLLLSVATYVVVGLSGVRVGEDAVPDPTLVSALALAAVVTGGIGQLFYRRARAADQERSGRLAAADSLAEGPRDPGRIFTSCMLAWIFDEAVAVYGLVLAFLGAPRSTWLAFCAASAILLVLHRPPRPGSAPPPPAVPA